MTNKFKILLWLTGLVLLLNSFVMRGYAVAIRSTYAFVASNTVFYLLAWTNFVLCLVMISVLILNLLVRRGK